MFLGAKNHQNLVTGVASGRLRVSAKR